MPKTGNLFIDSFSTIIVFLPLLPVAIVLMRKIFRDYLLNLLVLLCLLHFIQYFSQRLLSISDMSLYSLGHLFSFLETIVYIQIFRPFFTGRSREMLNFLIIALLSSLITYYLLNGTDHRRSLLMGLQYGLILALIGFCLPRLLQDDDLQIFKSAFFWIAAGTMFYLVVVILVELADHLGGSMHNRVANAADKAILLDIANVIRYLFYVLAAWLHKPGPKQQDLDMPS
jgi:hypothetical protein